MKRIILAAIVIAGSISGAANATIATVFNSQSAGLTNFNNVVASAGGTATAVQFVSGQSTYADFSLDKAPNTIYTSSAPPYTATTTGSTVGIDPAGPDTNPRSTPTDYRASGFNINFSSAVNSAGFEVGDWGTCCQPSSLYISFDDGMPIKVGESDMVNDVFLTDGQPIVFVGAFDDSGSFSKVTFWGDGVGEYLVAGGTLHYALLDKGSLPPVTGSVPEPANWALMIGGIGFVGGAMRRRVKQAVLFA